MSPLSEPGDLDLLHQDEHGVDLREGEEKEHEQRE
jgi:hypothetical protein